VPGLAQERVPGLAQERVPGLAQERVLEPGQVPEQVLVPVEHSLPRPC